jgi:hypothetical protein
MKEALPLAALPATSTQLVLDAIKDAYPQFFDGVDVLHTSFNNMGAIFHPALTLLNAGWIEVHTWRLPVLHRRRHPVRGAHVGSARP